MFRIPDLPLACLLMIGCGWFSSDLPAQQLRWNLKVGDQFAVEFNQQSDTQTTVDKRVTQINSSTTITMDWNVQSVAEDDAFVIEQTITGIALFVGDPAVPSQALEFDTTRTERPSRESAKILKQVQPLVGLKFVVSMNSDGKISSVEIPQETKSALADRPASLNLQSLFSESGMAKSFSQAVIEFPGDSLSVGESWETKSNLSTAFGDFDRVRRFKWRETEKKNERELARIELATNFEPANKSVQQSSGELISLSENGQFEFDLSGGYFATSEFKSLSQSTTPYRESKIETTVETIYRMTIAPR